MVHLYHFVLCLRGFVCLHEEENIFFRIGHASVDAQNIAHQLILCKKGKCWLPS